MTSGWEGGESGRETLRAREKNSWRKKHLAFWVEGKSLSPSFLSHWPQLLWNVHVKADRIIVQRALFVLLYTGSDTPSYVHLYSEYQNSLGQVLLCIDKHTQWTTFQQLLKGLYASCGIVHLARDTRNFTQGRQEGVCPVIELVVLLSSSSLFAVPVYCLCMKDCWGDPLETVKSQTMES